MRDYNPNTMFPKKPAPRGYWARIKATVKRWLAAFVLLVGAGCQNVRTIDAGFGGLDIEYYEPPPIIIHTNIIRTNFISPHFLTLPRLMERNK